MPNHSQPLAALAQFLPENTFEKVVVHFSNNPIHLTITRERQSVMGDYRPPAHNECKHRISVNGTLNPYAFLVTLLHELAHMYAWIQYGRKHKPHGPEWKHIFSGLLKDFLGINAFPDDIAQRLGQYANNIKAATCTDPKLYKILKRYDTTVSTLIYVDDVPFDKSFQTRSGRVFQKVKKLRSRYQCREISTGNIYFVPAIMEVQLVISDE